VSAVAKTKEMTEDCELLTCHKTKETTEDCEKILQECNNVESEDIG
jgi:hypothetical protein